MTDAYPDRPGLDTALSRALMVGASEGHIGETIRLYRPQPIVAFGKQDVRDPGYSAAVAAANRHGFVGIERLAGGRAAVFHQGTIAFAWTVPDPAPAERIHARFRAFTTVLVEAFHSLGVEARVGAIPGEYCPGDYSINVDGAVKVVGIGQRLARRAAHVGGVVVVSDGDGVRNVLTPVYAALRLGWDPATAGAIEDSMPGITVSDVVAAIVDRIGAETTIRTVGPDPSLLARAESLRMEHLSPPAAR